MRPFSIFILYIVVLNIVSFALMARDKASAKKRRRRRIRERTLLTLTTIGGALGTWVGMQVFHHKTKHLSFRYLAPIATVGWAIISLYLVYLGVLTP